MGIEKLLSRIIRGFLEEKKKSLLKNISVTLAAKRVTI